MSRLDEFGIIDGADIRKYGGTARVTYRALEGKLRLGLESGAASGDQWDNTVQGNTNIAYANLIGGPNDHKLTQFLFNRDYKVDMILFRHLIGAVTNAGYVKPFLSYDLTKSIGFKVANITSFALNPVATPGNETMYGTEFNADIGYTAGGFHGGVSTACCSRSARSHPEASATAITKTPASPTSATRAPRTIQFRAVLSF